MMKSCVSLTSQPLLVGDEEKIFYPKRWKGNREQQLMPTLEAAMIPNAAHLLIVDQPDTVNSRMLSFLTGWLFPTCLVS